MVVAIDGPAGAGKSTVARALARELGFIYLDSGAMYRAVALSLLAKPGNAAERARDVRIELGERVLLDGTDVTDAIRTREVSEAASRIASDPGVRAALVAKQRELLKSGDWVAEGRDIGTVVAPERRAQDLPDRVARRSALAGGHSISVAPTGAIVLRDQALRDRRTQSASIRRSAPRRTRSSSTPPTVPSRTLWRRSSGSCATPPRG